MTLILVTGKFLAQIYLTILTKDFKLDPKQLGSLYILCMEKRLLCTG